jgi:hypothetical protein
MKNPVGRPKGYKVSDDAKQLISKAHKGKIAINIRPISVDGVAYTSLRVASKALNVNETTIRYRVITDSAAFKNWFYI